MKITLYILSMVVVTVMVLILGTYMTALAPLTSPAVEWTTWQITKGLGLWILFWASIDFYIFARNKARD